MHSSATTAPTNYAYMFFIARQIETLASVPLPCSAAQLENAILKAAHNGHWHDAEVKVHGDNLVITYEDEDA